MINNIKTYFKEHWLGMVIALFIGLVVAAPPVIWHFSSEYRGLEMLKTNTESHYVAQVQEVYDGDPFLHNAFFEDLKTTPYLFPPLSPNIIAFIGKIFSLNAIQAVMLTRFLIVSLLAFLIYLFGYLITKNKLIGYVSAPAVILGYPLLDPKNILTLFGIGAGSMEMTFIDYGRPVNPQVSSLFFFAYLISFWKFLYEDKRKVLYGVLSSLILGLSFYVYLFTWTFIFSLNGFLCLIYLIKKDWVKFKNIIYVSLGATVLSIPYFYNTFIASQHEWYKESANRFGFVHSRDFNISRIVIGAVILFSLAYKKMYKQTRLFFGAFLLTALFVVNEQVITGLYVFNHHYHWYYNTPIVIIMFVVIFYSVTQKFFSTRKRAISILTFVLVALFFYNGIFVQQRSYKFALPQVIDEQRYGPVFDWLNSKTEKDSTVFSSDEFMDLAPALTHNSVYYHGTAVYTLVPDERLLHAYLVKIYLNNISKEGIELYLDEHQAEIAGRVFGYRYRFQKGVCSTCVNVETLSALARDYNSISDDNFIEFLKKYPVDYIIWDKKINPEWNLERFDIFEIEDNEDIAIFSVQ